MRKGKIYPSEFRVPNNSKERYERLPKWLMQGKKKKKEENIRMGKTRDLFKKNRYQGNISYKDGHNEGLKCHGR